MYTNDYIRPVVPTKQLAFWKTGTKEALAAINHFCHKADIHWKSKKICPFPKCPLVKRRNLEDHIIKTHLTFLPQVCETCFERFSCEKLLNQHAVNVHNLRIMEVKCVQVDIEMEIMQFLATPILLNEGYIRLKSNCRSKSNGRFILILVKLPYEIQCMICFALQNSSTLKGHVKCNVFNWSVKLLLHQICSQ